MLARWVVCLALVILLGWSNIVGANGLRCNNALVKRGDTAFDVLETCGQPDWQNTRYEEQLLGSVDSPSQIRRVITIDEWVYRGTPGRFDRLLVFYDGRLHRIDLGKRR
jgi:hypothetical protein